MKRTDQTIFITSLSFLLCFLSIYSQDKIAIDDSLKVSISFENSSIKDALNRIEGLTGYQFYYVEEWLGDKTISGNYEDIPVTKILDDIFNNSVLNYYVLNGEKVILTRNNIIYDELPKGFFKNEETPIVNEESEQVVETINPVFYNEEKPPENVAIETIRIGKEDRNSKQSFFILSGFIRNKETGEPLSNLAIVIRNHKIGTTTDEKGFYEIKLPPGLNTLETSSLGIESSKKNIIIYNNGQLDFDLNEKFEVLEEVVVEADAAKNVEEANTGTTQIESEESKNIPLILGERDILQVARTLPGITNAGEGASGFNVRGGKTDQNLILLDNAVVYNPSHFFGIFQALNPFTTKGVNIYKGNIPAEYGGRLSSVFDIETIDGNTEKFSGEASLGPVTANIALEIPLSKNKSSLVLGGRGTYSDWILRSLDDESLNNSSAYFYDGVVKYNNKINENNDLRATAYYSKDAFSITSDSLYNYSNRLVSLKWDHRFNQKNTGSLILANSEYRFNIDFDGSSNNDFALGYKIDETELKLKMSYHHSETHKFDYGISTKLYSVNPGGINPEGPDSIIEPLEIPKEKGLESAVFISDKFKISEKLLLDLGFRYSLFAALGPSSQRIYEAGVPRNEGTLIDTQEFDTNEIIKTYGGPEVRVSARYFIMPDFSVKASFNRSFQYIHTLSNNTTVSPIDTWKLTDTNIKPQRGNQYALGLYKNLEDNLYEISLEGYYKTSDNILDFKTGAQLLLNETIETEVLQGEGKAYGVEFLIRKKSGRLNGWLGYTYSRSLIKFDSPFLAERINDGQFFPSNYDKPHDVSLVANYRFTKRYSLSTNFVYQTGRPVTFPVGTFRFNNADFVFYSDRNAFRIPDYYRLDIGLNIEGNHRIKKFAHSFWTFSVYNVLGRNNPYSVFFVTENGEVKALQSSIFAIPIPSITYNFKF